jgi:hypothetical protein
MSESFGRNHARVSLLKRLTQSAEFIDPERELAAIVGPEVMPELSCERIEPLSGNALGSEDNSRRQHWQSVRSSRQDDVVKQMRDHVGVRVRDLWDPGDEDRGGERLRLETGEDAVSMRWRNSRMISSHRHCSMPNLMVGQRSTLSRPQSRRPPIVVRRPREFSELPVRGPAVGACPQRVPVVTARPPAPSQAAGLRACIEIHRRRFEPGTHAEGYAVAAMSTTTAPGPTFVGEHRGPAAAQVSSKPVW